MRVLNFFYTAGGTAYRDTGIEKHGLQKIIRKKRKRIQKVIQK